MSRPRNRNVRHAIARRMEQGQSALSREERRSLREEEEERALDQKIARIRAALADPSAPVPADISPAIIAQENLLDDREIVRQLVSGVKATNIDARVQRIIFFYSLDAKASFTERHDHTRACVAIIAYQMRAGQTRALDVAHLKAIVEHQHRPHEFRAREAFIRMFRDGTEPMMQVGSQERKTIDRARRHMLDRMAVATAAVSAAASAAVERELVPAFEGFTLGVMEEFDAMEVDEERAELVRIMDGRTGALESLMQQLRLDDPEDEEMGDG